MKYFYFRRKAL